MRAARLGRVMRRAAGFPDHGMPEGRVRPRLVVARHILRELARGGGARRAVADAVFFEIARSNFGWSSVLRGRHGFFPHIFLPDYHGPHFEEAVRRLVFSGRGPNILYFSLTGTCPCACEYCFAGAGALGPDLGDEVVLDTARRVAATGVPLVNISGGEPLVRYERLLAAVRALSAGGEVRMFTTGIGLTEGRVAELRAAGLKGVFVSLDGADPVAFDRARGRVGAFRDAVAALRRCAAADMLTFVNTVVDRRRFATRAEVERFLRFVADIDPRIAVNFLPQLATGRGAEADSFRAPAECEAVARRITEAARALGRPASMLFGRVDHFIGCPGAGGKLMNVDIEGNVTVCISRAALGNVKEEPFDAIHARFVASASRLKVGFFCCETAAEGQGALLDADASRAALARFHAALPDAEWQGFLDRYGAPLSWLFG